MWFLTCASESCVCRCCLQVAPWFHSLLGAILWLPQMLHILPAGLVCLVLRVLAAPFGGLNL